MGLSFSTTQTATTLRSEPPTRTCELANFHAWQAYRESPTVRLLGFDVIGNRARHNFHAELAAVLGEVCRNRDKYSVKVYEEYTEQIAERTRTSVFVAPPRPSVACEGEVDELNTPKGNNKK